jgi:hypothetical protein
MYEASRMQGMMQILKNPYFVTKFFLVYFGAASPRGGAMLRIVLMPGGDPVHVNITEIEKALTEIVYIYIDIYARSTFASQSPIKSMKIVK